jgi:hypothetical protein
MNMLFLNSTMNMFRCIFLFVFLGVIQLSCSKEPSSGIRWSPGTISTEDIVHLSAYRNGTNYFWDFGDGTREATTTYWTTHQYTGPGNYNVTVEVQDTVQTLFTLEATLTVNP